MTGPTRSRTLRDDSGKTGFLMPASSRHPEFRSFRQPDVQPVGANSGIRLTPRRRLGGPSARRVTDMAAAGGGHIPFSGPHAAQDSARPTLRCAPTLPPRRSANCGGTAAGAGFRQRHGLDHRALRRQYARAGGDVAGRPRPRSRRPAECRYPKVLAPSRQRLPMDTTCLPPPGTVPMIDAPPPISECRRR